MSWVSNTFNSTIGKKLIMSLTGLFLVQFLAVHLIGNLQIMKADMGYSFNTYAVFMTSNPLIKTVSYVLYASIIIHALYALFLTQRNKAARPVGYAVVNNQSVWSSRNMGILGSVILVFIVLHMAGFWGQYKFGTVPYVKYTTTLSTGEIQKEAYDLPVISKMEEWVEGDYKFTIVKDLNAIVVDAFKQIWIVIIYVISMVVVGFHLYHGFQSAFQTLGLNHKKYTPLIKNLGTAFSIGVSIGFAIIPIYVFLFI
jgi:succinate dehydrogenase / fumarate reductase, cytochrome b subunit